MAPDIGERPPGIRPVKVALRVAMLTARAHLRAAGHGVPGGVRPFDLAAVTHHIPSPFTPRLSCVADSPPRLGFRVACTLHRQATNPQTSSCGSRHRRCHAARRIRGKSAGARSRLEDHGEPRAAFEPFSVRPHPRARCAGRSPHTTRSDIGTLVVLRQQHCPAAAQVHTFPVIHSFAFWVGHQHTPDFPVTESMRVPAIRR